MSEAKHTPGPWLYRAKNDSVYTEPPAGTAFQYGSFIFGFDRECAPDDRDLTLILAAPNLLKNLEALVQWYGARDNSECSGVLLPYSQQEREIQDAMRAIAEAKGEVLP